MIKNILKGIKAYAGILKLISKLKLWKFFIIPIIISLVIAIVIAFVAYGWSDNIGVYVTKIWKWEFGKETFATISNFIGGVIIIVFGFILYKHIVMALSAPFMNPVSEKIEAYLTNNEKHTHRETSFNALLWRGIKINSRNLFKEILVTIPLLILSFIPVIGLIATIILFLVQAYFAGFGNMDYTLERHFSYKDSISFVRKNKGIAIGNGIVFILFLLIPVLGVILVLPFSVTAASAETVELLNAENNIVLKKT